MQYEFKVITNTGDRRTLTQRGQNDMGFSDCPGALCANDDPANFYREVARKLARHHVEEDVFTYEDDKDSLPGHLKAINSALGCLEANDIARAIRILKDAAGL